MENVPEARSSNAYARACTILKRSGYGLTEKVLDMSLYGVPQARERFIVIGRLDEADGFLESALEAAASLWPMTVRDLLGDEVGVHPGGEHPPQARVYFLRPFKGYPGVRSIDAPCPIITSKSDGRASRNQPQHADDLASRSKFVVTIVVTPPRSARRMSVEDAHSAEIAFLRQAIYRKDVEPYTQRITAFERFKAAS